MHPERLGRMSNFFFPHPSLTLPSPTPTWKKTINLEKNGSWMRKATPTGLAWEELSTKIK